MPLSSFLTEVMIWVDCLTYRTRAAIHAEASSATSCIHIQLSPAAGSDPLPADWTFLTCPSSMTLQGLQQVSLSKSAAAECAMASNAGGTASYHSGRCACCGAHDQRHSWPWIRTIEQKLSAAKAAKTAVIAQGHVLQICSASDGEAASCRIHLASE